VYTRGVGTSLKCPEGKVQKGVECYDPPPPGYNWTTQGGLLIGKVCPPGTNDSGTTCWYDRGVGTVPTCPSDKVQKGVECYEAPSQGYDWTTPGGILVGKVCPPGTNDSGTTCWYDRGVGKVPTCPSDKVQKGVECYDPPPQGYDWTTPGGILVGKVCPPGTNDSGTTCWYDRGVGTVPTCPSDKVQKGIECYDSPPQGYDWTTPGGILIGKVCPPGTNDSGTTCWYDRGVGRIPDKNPCPSGMRDDGTSCWKDSYGRGVGRIPDKAPCPDGMRDDGTSCWEDLKCTTKDNGYYNYSWGSVNCTDGRPWRFQGYSDCYKTWIAKLETTCSGCGCIKKTLFDRQSCKADEEMNGGLCYPKCATGYHATGCCLCEPDGGVGIKVNLFDRQYCKDDEVLEAGLCYPKPREGFTCTATHCEFSKDVKGGTKTGLIASCPDDKILQDGMCYPKPREGFQCRATTCDFSKEVRPGTKTGVISTCADDKVLQDGMCYSKPRDGFQCRATTCDFSKEVKPGNKTGVINVCPPDKLLQDGMCYPKPQEGFTCNATHCQFGKDVKSGNKTGVIDTCPPDKEKVSGLCYTKPKDGFKCELTKCVSIS
jgi:hypothetical protein